MIVDVSDRKLGILVLVASCNAQLAQIFGVITSMMEEEERMTRTIRDGREK